MAEITLTKNFKALVSDEDLEFLSQFKWCVSRESSGKKFYAIRMSPRQNGQKRKKVRMHRLIAERAFGEIPAGLVVDHLNNNSLDNRRENLEIVTQTENMNRVRNWKKKKSTS